MTSVEKMSVPTPGSDSFARVSEHASARSLSLRALMAIVFWMLCMTLTAGGHRFYKAIVMVDRTVSATEYRTNGAPLVWMGYGSVEDSRKQFASAVNDSGAGQLHVLPNSWFWLGAAVFFIVCGGLLAWWGRWIKHQGIQSLIGLFAGHFLWLGAIEFGLEAAGRRIGLASSLEMVGGRVVGAHSAGSLIQLSVVFLVPVLIGLTMHESNRCALFQWFRRRLPLAVTAAASGRVENYAARTAMQYFVTVWFCYVSVLWLADPRLGKFGEIGLLLTMLVISLATPYMIWRTARQSSNGQALRYSVSGAVVTWTAIEIAAAMNIFHEPWLSDSFLSGMVLLALSILLTGLATRYLFSSRSREAHSPLPVTLLLAAMLAVSGCGSKDPAPQIASQNAEEIEQRLREYEATIEFPPSATDGLLHALGSNDPEMRAQAAFAFGKSRGPSPVVKAKLESMASSDESRLAQFAALAALDQLGTLSPQLQGLLQQLRDDPKWGRVAKSIGD